MNDREQQKRKLDKFCYEVIEVIESCNLEQLEKIRTNLNFLDSNNRLMMHDLIGGFLTLSTMIDHQREKLKGS